MISIDQFHEDFLQGILIDSQSRGLLRPQAFFENVCEELINSGDLSTNYTFAEYTKKGMEVHGYDYDEERKILSLLVYEFFQEDDIQTLIKGSIDTKFNRLKTFLSKTLEGFHTDMEETTDSYSMAYNIYRYHETGQLNKVRFILITDGKATRNLKELPPIVLENYHVEPRVVDIEYIYKTYLSENIGSDFEIDVDLPCLEIGVTDEYESYLAVLPGTVVADVYDKFGQKLLEQNVRTFLQFRSKVNKGLLNTIDTRPEMFFAFNNGVTATASDVFLGDDGNIKKITNFQIVNGGQTVSSIYAASKGPGSKKPMDITRVFVQMKLSIVKNKEKQHDFVSDVSEYANTQNKVNKSDFFSNSPFHREMKKYSKLVRVPAIGGGQIKTHWFYERVRGEYLNEQAYLTSAKKTQFQIENPRKQLIDKTLLAKSENTWRQLPDVVSKGAQYSFDEFAKQVTDKLEKDNLAITESYFKDAISRIILFKSVEKLVSDAEWYGGGYRANIVTYTIAMLSHLVEKSKGHMNFNAIWEEQKVPQKLVPILRLLAKTVFDLLTNPPEGSANISQWAKKQKCWEEIKALDLNIELPEELLLDSEEKSYEKREEKKVKKLDSDIEIQAFVIKAPQALWMKLYSYYSQDDSTVSPMQLDMLSKIASGSLGLPSAKQSKILYKLVVQSQNEGYVLEGV